MVWLKIPTTRHPHEGSCRKRPGTTKSTKKSLSFVLFVCFVVQIAVRRVKAPGLNGQAAGSNSSIGADRLDAVIARRLGHRCGLHQIGIITGDDGYWLCVGKSLNQRRTDLHFNFAPPKLTFSESLFPVNVNTECLTRVTRTN